MLYSLDWYEGMVVSDDGEMWEQDSLDLVMPHDMVRSTNSMMAYLDTGIWSWPG